LVEIPVTPTNEEPPDNAVFPVFVPGSTPGEPGRVISFSLGEYADLVTQGVNVPVVVDVAYDPVASELVVKYRMGEAASQSTILIPRGGNSLDPQELDTLERVTADLHAGDPVSGWVGVTQNQMGVNVERIEPTESALRALTNWSVMLSSGVGGGDLSVRIAKGIDPQQARVQMKAPEGIYNQLVSQLQAVGSSEDGNWNYYTDGQMSWDITTVVCELTGASAGIGSTRFVGRLSVESVYDALKQILKGSVVFDDAADTATFGG